jgi:hypothetical protein
MEVDKEDFMNLNQHLGKIENVLATMPTPEIEEDLREISKQLKRIADRLDENTVEGNCFATFECKVGK